MKNDLIFFHKFLFVVLSVDGRRATGPLWPLCRTKFFWGSRGALRWNVKLPQTPFIFSSGVLSFLAHLFLGLFRIEVDFIRWLTRRHLNMAPRKTKAYMQSQVYIVDFRFTFPEQDPTLHEGWVALINEYFVPLCKRWCFQVEHSRPLEHEDGPNIHIQGFGSLSVKERPRTIAVRLNKHLPGIRVSAASTAGCVALRKYTQKEEGRLYGPWCDPSNYKGDDLWAEEKMPRWQQDLIKILRGPVQERVIYWHYDPEGGQGKSKFRKWASMNLNAVCIDYDTTSNIRMHAINGGIRKVYIVNLTRAKPKDIGSGDLYSALESIKDGHVISGKYKGNELLMMPPHVVVFANDKPADGMWTHDRCTLIEMSKSKNVRDAEELAQRNRDLLQGVQEDWDLNEIVGDLQAWQERLE